ncbi:MAG: hypothetical protein CO093_09935 [Alphaproteobacteria bacterium CG_4_9_14_3_um_filter_47_13]|nr:MAG: hypothetical protein CO093_09935 [Alphaproteobacteria bacterium CG_4_9_14_3_um_filter_47_13]
MACGFEALLKGFAVFCEEHYGDRKSLMPRLVEKGQDPDYFIISCIDSRSNPGILFQAEPGTFFGHKAMGAIVRPYQKGTALAAALQFAINYNKVSKIILLGHTGCGAIRALAENLDDPEISSFISVAREGLEQAKKCCADDSKHDDLLRHAEEQIVLLSTENLKTYPSVQKALAEGRLEIASWLFNMEAGAIYSYAPENGKFIALPLPRL